MTSAISPSSSSLSRPSVRVGTIKSLSSSARHHITLREQKSGDYHSLLLFSFPVRAQDVTEDEDGSSTRASMDQRKFYCMEATCPHLGAPLENATIEEQDDEDDIEDMVVVCPWHEYDFNLRTGESSHGVQACVYVVEQKLGDGSIWIETPTAGSSASHWELVEVRPVSEAFSARDRRRQHFVAAAGVANHAATSEELTKPLTHLSLFSDKQAFAGQRPYRSEADEAPASSISPPEPQPKTLVEWACLILNTAEPRRKVAYTRMAAAAFRSGRVKLIGGGYARSCSQAEEEVAHQKSDAETELEPSASIPQRRWTWTRSTQETPPRVPPRLESAIIVEPGQLGKRGKGGTVRSRIALLHSLANIEQWAIDLAWDIIARAPELAHGELVGTSGSKKLPVQFFTDFLKVAEDEAKHFSLLTERIEALGSHFGALPVHHGLWQSASETMHSLPARLAIIHLVHEARGLDVNPTTIQKFRNAQDAESVDILTIIHLDEITHVSAGHRWLSYLCAHAEPPKDPVAVFREEVRLNFVGKVKGPFNSADRAKAGLSKEWYDGLQGEKSGIKPIGAQRAEVAGG
ncbi:DUF455-domain-containing protein [Tilletiaria anomala UBC 951]|uniref:DUF455-domain-containing protein n=1 Tax=Tilletiaria anomala (strain ATCC 24038 / CBS 436.72 / UBC 951) TaxID=1037660 RepID=A0A066VUU8_TILAU|nr:DUF455-domain-containing protein [Tilletiaria anomala UBC 951]KDN45256.1 DUF455-domain-containing protein [Tilletiaria anomala UBC 951]